MAFGYIGENQPTQDRTANAGIFDMPDIDFLISQEQWALQDLDGEYLVVAGGGGGGGGQHAASHYRGGGGGGAGGMLEQTADTFHFKPNTDYAVVIGSGGGGGYNAGGSQGGTSSLEIDNFDGSKTTISTTGGGLGNSYYSAGGVGGSGGGNGSRQQTYNRPGIAGQGNEGRRAISGREGGGGGGKGSGGGASSAGGDGLANDITGSSVTYAQGRFTNSGASNSNGSNGTANRGMGGSGTSRENRTAGTGGSGIVIVTVPTGRGVTIGAGLTGTTNTVGDKQVVSITAGSGNLRFS